MDFYFQISGPWDCQCRVCHSRFKMKLTKWQESGHDHGRKEKDKPIFALAKAEMFVVTSEWEFLDQRGWPRCPWIPQNSSPLGSRSLQEMSSSRCTKLNTPVSVSWPEAVLSRKVAPTWTWSPENCPVLTGVMSSHVPWAGSDSQVGRMGRQVLNLPLQNRLPEASDSSKSE